MGEAGAKLDPPSPTERGAWADDTFTPATYQHSIIKSTTPLWFRTLFPLLPRPIDTEDGMMIAAYELDEDDDDEDEESSSDIDLSTDAAVQTFMDALQVRLQLLQRIRAHLTSNSGAQRRKTLNRYSKMRIDTRLLDGVSSLFRFISSAVEHVHHCAINDLQHRSIRVCIEALHVMRAMTMPDELDVRVNRYAAENALNTDDEGGEETKQHMHAPSIPARANIADRLIQHNAAEILLMMFEACFEEMHGYGHGSMMMMSFDHHSLLTHEEEGGMSHQRTCHVAWMDAILRCLISLMEHSTKDSIDRVNVFRQCFLFIPSHSQVQPISMIRDPAEGSNSEICRMMVSLVQLGHKHPTLASLAVEVLAHIATTPIVNEHVHSPDDCGLSPAVTAATPKCTRGAPCTPVITYPVRANSLLAVASKLFLFPANPALYLVERMELLTVLLEIFAPFLQKPFVLESHAHHPYRARVLSVEHGSTKVGTPASRGVGRSLFGKVFGEDEDEDGDGTLSSAALSSSPSFSRSNVHQMDDDEATAGHHASSILSASKFIDVAYSSKPDPHMSSSHAIMQEQYGPSRNSSRRQSMSHEAISIGTERSTGGNADMPSSIGTLKHHRSAPLHESNEMVAAALHGVAALATRTPSVAFHLCNVPGFISFLSSLLDHPQCLLRMRAIALVGVMDHALNMENAASMCSVPLNRADGPPPPLNLQHSKSRTLSRRNSEVSGMRPINHRRRSRDLGASPLRHAVLTHGFASSPNSPLMKAHGSPRALPSLFLSMQEPTQPSQRLTLQQARHLIAPLATRSVQLVLIMMQQLWPASSKIVNGGHGMSHSGRSGIRALNLLSNLVAHSARLQQEASTAIPLLVRLLSAPALPSTLRIAGLRCLVSLTGECSRNRQRLLQSRALECVVVPLLHTLPYKESSIVRSKDNGPHPRTLEMQVACVDIVANVTASYDEEKENVRVQALTDPAMSKILRQVLIPVLSFIDSAHLPLRVPSYRLISHLMRPSSPVRGVLSDASVLTKLIRIVQESAMDLQRLYAHVPVLEQNTPTIADMLRIHAMQGLCALSSSSPHVINSGKYKATLMDELSIDGVLSLLPDVDDNEKHHEHSHVPESIQVGERQMGQLGWTLLRNLLDVEGTSAASTDSEHEGWPVPSFSQHDIARILDVIEQDLTASSSGIASIHPPRHVRLLSTIAARNDGVSKDLLCNRSALLAHIHFALKQSGEEATWGALCIANLLQQSEEERKKDELEASARQSPKSGDGSCRTPDDCSTPSTPTSSAPHPIRAKLLQAHDLFLTLIEMTKTDAPTTRHDAPIHADFLPHSASAASPSPSLSPTMDAQKAAQRCLLLMHDYAIHYALEPDTTLAARYQLLAEYVTSIAEKHLPSGWMNDGNTAVSVSVSDTATNNAAEPPSTLPADDGVEVCEEEELLDAPLDLELVDGPALDAVIAQSRRAHAEGQRRHDHAHVPASSSSSSRPRTRRSRRRPHPSHSVANHRPPSDSNSDDNNLGIELIDGEVTPGMDVDMAVGAQREVNATLADLLHQVSLTISNHTANSRQAQRVAQALQRSIRTLRRHLPSPATPSPAEPLLH